MGEKKRKEKKQKRIESEKEGNPNRHLRQIRKQEEKQN
jgi:hypothetical protein